MPADTLTRETPCKKCGESLSMHVLTRTKDDLVTLEPNWCGGILPILDMLAAQRAEIDRLLRQTGEE